MKILKCIELCIGMPRYSVNKLLGVDMYITNFGIHIPNLIPATYTPSNIEWMCLLYHRHQNYEI